MNDEDKYKIISNSYADLLVEYNDDIEHFNRYPNNSVNLINRKSAVVHLPICDITPDCVSKYGYSSIPACYGLLSSPGHIASGITRIRKIPGMQLKGRGVLIGFVDTGIDYTHPAFINPDNTTRILSLWDQTIDSDHNYPKGFYYGTEYTRKQVNMALKCDTPLSVVPSVDTVGHGTMLAGIAAGTPVKEYGFMGIVPCADLVIVKLKTAKPYLKDFYGIPQDCVCFQENDIILGVKYLTQLAGRLNRPIVICIGLGSSQGDYSGNGFLSRYLSNTADIPHTAVIVSAGNEGNTGHHYYGETVLNPDRVELLVSHVDSGFSMEFLGISPAGFWIDIFAPTGEFVTRIPPFLSHPLYLTHQNTSIIIDTDSKEVPLYNQLILLRFQNPAAGIWSFLVYEEESGLPLKYHIWLPMTNFLSPDTFFIKSSIHTTLTTPGSNSDPICITAYNPINQSLYYYASRGFSAVNIPKPDLAAPGVNVLCPGVTSQFVNATGTSLAAAHAAGAAAMLLEWGIIRGNFTYMNNNIIKKILIQGAKRDAKTEYPNSDWGYGIIDVFNTYRLIHHDKELITKLFSQT